MTEPKKPNTEEPQRPQQDEDGVGDAESFANIEPDDGTSFANIDPAKE